MKFCQEYALTIGGRRFSCMYHYITSHLELWDNPHSLTRMSQVNQTSYAIHAISSTASQRKQVCSLTDSASQCPRKAAAFQGRKPVVALLACSFKAAFPLPISNSTIAYIFLVIVAYHFLSLSIPRCQDGIRQGQRVDQQDRLGAVSQQVVRPALCHT